MAGVRPMPAGSSSLPSVKSNPLRRIDWPGFGTLAKLT